MNIAITGATGFIGGHLLERLERSGQHKIVIIVRTLPSSISINAKTTSIVHIDLDESVENAYAKLGQPDLLIHLAWGSLTSYDSESHAKKVLPSHYAFLEGIIKDGLKSLIVAGTCLEYGMLSGQLTEDMCCNPTTEYGSAKNQLKQRLDSLKESYSFNFTWMRLFYIDGDNPSRTTLLGSLKAAANNGDKYFNMSNGDQLRDFISIDQLTLNIEKLALKMQDFGVVNICSGKPVSVENYVRHKMKENGWHFELNLGYYPYPQYEPFAFWGDVKKLNRICEADS